MMTVKTEIGIQINIRIFEYEISRLTNRVGFQISNAQDPDTPEVR